MVKIAMMINNKFKVACIIPTYNAGSLIHKLHDSIKIQKSDFDIFFVDSSSNDGTFEFLTNNYSNVFKISKSEFNHGGTRQRLVVDNSTYDILVFLTQDAILANECSIQNIVSHFDEPSVGAVCGRQLPHINANVLSRHARFFNYPGINKNMSKCDITTTGIKTAFLSNSFSAYRTSALLKVGGFPSHVILSEDMYVGARLILNDFKIVYAADATCYHSHNYSLLEEFKRYFDIGVFHAREDWIRRDFGGAGGEGLKYVKSEIKFLWPNNIHLIPESFLRNALKLIAYKLGQLENKLPNSLKRKLSMHKGFWV